MSHFNPSLPVDTNDFPATTQKRRHPSTHISTHNSISKHADHAAISQNSVQTADGGTVTRLRLKRERAVKKATAAAPVKKVKKCRNCRKSFRGIERKLFCSDSCRATHHKRQQRKAAKREDVHLQMCECVHCGRTYLSAHKSRLYCGKNCRNKACDRRREAAIDVLALHFGRSREWGADYVDSRGMVTTGKALAALGYSYAAHLRAWISALTASA